MVDLVYQTLKKLYMLLLAALEHQFSSSGPSCPVNLTGSLVCKYSEDFCTAHVGLSHVVRPCKSLLSTCVW